MRAGRALSIARERLATLDEKIQRRSNQSGKENRDSHKQAKPRSVLTHLKIAVSDNGFCIPVKGTASPTVITSSQWFDCR
jgi:hypothetical protein